MKKSIIRVLSLALCMSFALTVSAQSDPVLVEIGGQKIHKSEFMKEFLRSIGQSPEAAPTACTYEKRQALEEYLELFVNYRLKLTDAYLNQFDTIKSIKRELSGYRKELAAPYLIDSATMQMILREAYDRNRYAIHASHILIRVDKNAAPADTLAAYKKAIEVYAKANAGGDFNKLAIEYSDDPSAKGDLGQGMQRRGNAGDLGTFTVFQMVYPFESAAYALEPGQVCKPVRTQFGYHIIKLHEKIPFFGKCTLQHIWVSSKNPNAQQVANDAYIQLKEGKDFAAVAKNYSDDRAENGGYTPNLDMNQMPVEYVSHVSSLKEGEFSEPFRTVMGWHIVRLVKKDALPPFEDMVPVYQQRLARDQRNTAPKEEFAMHCKDRYGFTDYTKMYEKKSKKNPKPKALASLDEAVAAMTDSVYRMRWHYSDTMVTDMRPLFKLGNKEYTCVDFLKYIEKNQSMVRNMGDYATYINGRYKDFTNDMAVAYADENLEVEHPEFKELLDEYRHGLMIFSYNDKLVWGKAIKDTLGLKQFYKDNVTKHSMDNPEDDPYFWNTRANVINIVFFDSISVKPAKAKKIVAKYMSGKINKEEMFAQLEKAGKGEIVPFQAETSVVEEGNSSLLKNNEYKTGVYERSEKKGYRILVVDEVMMPAAKGLMEARGYYINDYQNYLDAQLVKKLRTCYGVKIHQDVFDAITY